MAILETQARQLDVLLQQQMGVKEGKRPWLSGLARHGFTGGGCGSGGRQQGQGQEQTPRGPTPPLLRVALGLDGDTSISTCESGGRRGGTAGGDSSAGDVQDR